MTDSARIAVIALINQQLADHYVLMTKTRFYHWNISGPEFNDLHELLDSHYGQLAEMVDEIAEQALKLGGQAAGTLAWFTAHSRISEDQGEAVPNTREMLANLLDAHEMILSTLHTDMSACENDYEDHVTGDMFQDMSAAHHKMAWMLRMLIQPSTLV
jgi:starvation-inducible DNA-binding protein